mgnify:CR=1 FL=1
MRVLLLSLLLMGCSTLNPDTYRAQQPTFDLFEFFDGQVTAYGIVQNRAGQVIQRFEVDIRGTVQDNVLTLDEDFVYTLGEGPGNRIWTIERQGEAFLGSATDVPGPALGESYGNAFRFRYTMDLPVGDTHYAVNFDDWFYAMDDQRIFNRSEIKKFGLTFAEVTIFMQRN